MLIKNNCCLVSALACEQISLPVQRSGGRRKNVTMLRKAAALPRVPPTPAEEMFLEIIKKKRSSSVSSPLRSTSHQTKHQSGREESDPEAQACNCDTREDQAWLLFRSRLEFILGLTSQLQSL